MDLLLKTGYVQSVILQPGKNVLDIPLVVEQGTEPCYEINPIDEEALCHIHAFEVLHLEFGDTPELIFLDLSGGFVRVRAENNGTLVLAAPYDPYWRAECDNIPVEPIPGQWPSQFAQVNT